MKNKLFKGLSLSANPKHLIKGVFFAAQRVFAEFGIKNHTFGNNKFSSNSIKGSELFRVARNDAERNNIAFKSLDAVRQYASKFLKTAESGVDKVVSSCEKNPSVHWRYMNFLRQRKTALDAPLYEVSAGRSMIEMLGVLAIIAVLTVGGIAGYSKAMEKFKINKALDEYTMLIYGLLQDIDYIQNLDTKEGNEIWLLDYAEAVGILPNNWHRHNGKITDDTFGNTLHIFARNNRLVFDIYLQGGSTPLCREFYINLIKPLHEVLYYGRQFGSNGSTFFGDRYCDDSSRICLNSLTLSDIQETCKKCEKSCYLGLEF